MSCPVPRQPQLHTPPPLVQELTPRCPPHMCLWMVFPSTHTQHQSCPGPHRGSSVALAQELLEGRPPKSLQSPQYLPKEDGKALMRPVTAALSPQAITKQAIEKPELEPELLRTHALHPPK
ncbi:hypothetical protein P7K49_032706 [Saguinus oedipus]|uniref:Uncharacterized protein n=1 Tax=Saguinus oedipus TaxID=9490 RepID=A0ABQ9TQ72_SAGOE|nr:hypothetical protein P7K49_032706 [Saguinus oedipus]